MKLSNEFPSRGVGLSCTKPSLWCINVYFYFYYYYFFLFSILFFLMYILSYSIVVYIKWNSWWYVSRMQFTHHGSRKGSTQTRLIYNFSRSHGTKIIFILLYILLIYYLFFYIFFYFFIIYYRVIYFYFLLIYSEVCGTRTLYSSPPTQTSTFYAF